MHFSAVKKHISKSSNVLRRVSTLTLDSILIINVESDTSLFMVSPTGRTLLSGSKAFKRTIALNLSSKWILSSTSSNEIPTHYSRGLSIKVLSRRGLAVNVEPFQDWSRVYGFLKRLETILRNSLLLSTGINAPAATSCPPPVPPTDLAASAIT